MVRLFKGTCEAVRAMHTYRAPVGPHPSSSKPAQNSSSSSSQQPGDSGRHSDDDERFPQAEGDGDDGYSYGAAMSVPLVTKHRVEEEGEVVFDGDEELSQLEQHGNGHAQPGTTEVVPYAHRDLKPGYAHTITLFVNDGSYLFPWKERHDCRRRSDPHPYGFWEHSESSSRCGGPYTGAVAAGGSSNVYLSSYRLIFALCVGYCCGTKHDGISGSRVVRR